SRVAVAVSEGETAKTGREPQEGLEKSRLTGDAARRSSSGARSRTGTKAPVPHVRRSADRTMSEAPELIPFEGRENIRPSRLLGRLVLGEPAARHRIADDVGARAQMQLFDRRCLVRFDRLDAERERAGDLLVASP